MNHRLRIVAGIVCLGAGLVMLAFGDRAAAWASNVGVAGVVMCVAAGLLLAPVLRPYILSRRGPRGEDFPVRPPREPRGRNRDPDQKP